MLGVAVLAGAGVAVAAVPTRVTKPAATPVPVVVKQPAILAAVKPAQKPALQPVVQPVVTRVLAALRSVGAVQAANVVRVVAGPVTNPTALVKSTGPVVNVVPGMAIRPPFRPPPRSAYRPPARPPYGPPF
jgi:hypothetical protein